MRGFAPVLLALALIAIHGCGRKDEATPEPPSTRPTTAPVEAAVPASSTLIIDGKPVAFPASSLGITDTGEALSLLLYSPEFALMDDPTANTVLLNMTAEVDSQSDLPTASIHLVGAATGNENDTPNGLFLNGSATQLLPLDVQVTFSGDAAGVIVAQLSGKFAAMTNAAAERTVTVTGTLAATVDREGATDVAPPSTGPLEP